MLFDLETWLAEAPPSPPIVQAGATVLRHRALEVGPTLLSTPALSLLIEIMIQAMRAAPGVGLAAPQLGVPLRVFVAEDDEERLARLSEDARALKRRVALPLTVLVNPRVSAISSDEAIFYEGCLSVRGYGALVARAAAVSVTGTDGVGNAVSMNFDGWPARIMQHEMDHLDGTLYVDRMLTRSLAADDELARLSALPVSDVMKELDIARARNEPT
jgi:peptide deformylase